MKHRETFLIVLLVLLGAGGLALTTPGSFRAFYPIVGFLRGFVSVGPWAVALVVLVVFALYGIFRD